MVCSRILPCWASRCGLALVSCLLLGSGSCQSSAYRASVSRDRARDFETAPLMQVLQVAPPVAVPNKDCQQVLMSYSFANSYNAPFVEPYQPPSCSFNRIVMNLTVTAAGRQFDRLAVMYLNDTEVFRTSTAEPTVTGIIWTYVKDMSSYLSLFREPQKIIFDLGNIVDKTYTAPFNATLTAIFFNDDNAIPAADLILPISAKKSASDSASAFNYPETNATGVLTLPRNTKKAVFSIAACGQIGEEFWWSNVPSTTIKTFPSAGDLYGYSAWRELQLYIDGSLAGVAWPFPIIFTGGVVPGFWRPVVGIDAFDLREDEIDITPWLPLLTDGKEHSYEIRVAGIDDDGHGSGTVRPIGSPGYWIVTGKVFVWLDKPGSITSGTPPVVVAPPPQLSVNYSLTKNDGFNATNNTLSYTIVVQRHLSIFSTLMTSDGTKFVKWEQNLDFENIGNLSSNGYVQYVTQRTHGRDTSSNGYSRTFNYPLYCYSALYVFPDNSIAINGTIDRGKEAQTQGQLSSTNDLETFSPSAGDFCGSDFRTRQNGTAGYYSGSNSSRGYSYGSTEQDLTFAGLHGDSVMNIQLDPRDSGSATLYHRHILAVNGTIVADSSLAESGNVFTQSIEPVAAPDMVFAVKSIRQMLGRGPST